MAPVQEQPATSLAWEKLWKQKLLHRARRAAQRQLSHPALTVAPGQLRKTSASESIPPSHASLGAWVKQKQKANAHTASLQLERIPAVGFRGSLFIGPFGIEMLQPFAPQLPPYVPLWLSLSRAFSCSLLLACLLAMPIPKMAAKMTLLSYFSFLHQVDLVESSTAKLSTAGSTY